MKTDNDAGAALALALALLLPARPAPAAPPPPKAAPAWASPVPMPEGSEPYSPARHTQSIFILSTTLPGGVPWRGDVIERVPLADPKWLAPGGIQGLTGWKALKYRLVPGPVRQWVGDAAVENSSKVMQTNRAILREYPEGARFDELLFNADGRLFEHRTREKVKGRWRAFVAHKDEDARPEGYAGLKVSCASCHDLAATGGYAEGLVPGGDGVLSDPLSWRRAKASAPAVLFRDGK